MSNNCIKDDSVSSDSSDTAKFFKRISSWSVKQPPGQAALNKNVVSKKVMATQNVNDDVLTDSSDTAIIMEQISTRNVKKPPPKPEPKVIVEDKELSLQQSLTTSSVPRQSPRSSTKFQQIKVNNKLKSLKEVKNYHSSLGFHKDTRKSTSFESGSDGYNTETEEDIVDEDYEDLFSCTKEDVDDLNSTAKPKAVRLPITTCKKPANDIPNINTDEQHVDTVPEGIVEEDLVDCTSGANADFTEEIAELAKQLKIPIYFSSREDAKNHVRQSQINCQRSYYIVKSDD
jgi:hypothetical protein